MVILSVSIYVTVAGCGAAETPFFFSLTIELTAPWQPGASELTSVKVSWHQQNPLLFYFPLAFFSTSDTIRAGSALDACTGPGAFHRDAALQRVGAAAPAPAADAPSLARSSWLATSTQIHEPRIH